MTWWIWRQHRAQFLAAAGLLAVLAAWMGVSGVGLANQYRDLGIAACLKGGGDCGSLTDTFLQLHQGLTWLVPLFLILPGLIGVFWGAALVAREVESGTHRLAWTQSISRRRWLAFQLGLLGAGTAALSALFAWLVTWWSWPLASAGHNGFNPGIFDLRGMVLRPLRLRPGRGGRNPRAPDGGRHGHHAGRLRRRPSGGRAPGTPAVHEGRW